MPALEGGEPKASGDEPPADVIPLSRADAARTLLERHRSGEREAFVELMKMFSAPVYSYLTRTGVRASDRDDLFQEVFCKVHRALQKKMPDGPVKPWVLRIAVNTARDHFRRAKVRSVVKLDADAGEAERPAPGADAELAARETARFLEAAIQQLPIAQREALLLASVAELGVKGAAEVLEVPTDTVKTRLRRARATLALAMQRREGSLR